MRKIFIRTLLDLADQDERIVLLTGDLGYSVLEPFQQRFPNRFFNVGVAEQNMVGIATGLAEENFIPFLYSIATFGVLRPYEFIRNGPILHRSKVRIIGVGPGFEYGSAGITHHALEDLGVLRLQPGITIITPADDLQTESALRATWDLPGPIYFRISKNEGVLPNLNGKFELGFLQILQSGNDILVVVNGPVAKEALAASQELKRNGITCQIVVLSSLNPAPYEELATLMAQYDLVVALESHYEIGGIGSLLSEIVAERGIRCRVIRQGVKLDMKGITGNEQFLNDRTGLSHQNLVKTIKENWSA